MLEAKLTQIGLNAKEAKIYLAILAHPNTSVQIIARKACIARSTTYFVIESLIQKGLVTQSGSTSKTQFFAEIPSRLLELITNQEQSISHQKNILQQIIPELLALAASDKERPTVRLYTGINGIKTMRSEMAQYANSEGEWLSLMPLDHVKAVFGNKYLYDRQRIAKKIPTRTLLTTRSKTLMQKILSDKRRDFTERRFLSPDIISSEVGFIIYKHRISIGAFIPEPYSLLIESPEIAEFSRQMFNLVWNYTVAEPNLDLKTIEPNRLKQHA